MRFLVAVAYEGDPSAGAYSQSEADSVVITTAMGRGLCFLDKELEAQWQRHRGASLQGLDFSALMLCGALQVRHWPLQASALPAMTCGSTAGPSMALGRC